MGELSAVLRLGPLMGDNVLPWRTKGVPWPWRQGCCGGCGSKVPSLLGKQEPGPALSLGELELEEATKSESFPAVSLLTFHLSQVFTEVSSLCLDQ